MNRMRKDESVEIGQKRTPGMIPEEVNGKKHRDVL